MVKFASSLLIATLVAVPAFAQANWDDLDTRDLSETDFFGRELTDAEVAVLARDIDELYTRFPEAQMLATREIEDLAERSKIGNFFKKIWHGIKKVASICNHSVIRREEGAEGEVFARDYDEVDARDLDALYERYVEEIEERTPGFLSFMKDGMKHVKQVAHAGNALEAPAPQPSPPANEAREFDDLAERDLFDEEDMYERDLNLNLDLSERDFEDELYEREFDEELQEREFDEELQERDLEEELYERDYPEEDLYEREFEEEDLLEREYYDDLD
ncbi:hypothetical protein BDZ97DRAFT_1759735 [Flammula alnicola]|nr:hypothetical protein BDZ97DRAFT_1759735 [Flammula alnicola]